MELKVKFSPSQELISLGVIDVMLSTLIATVPQTGPEITVMVQSAKVFAIRGSVTR
ncbi:hypothetical protein D3C72_798040 [compost metagenome]